MRTNIDLDDDLVARAMELGGMSTKKAAVDQALRDFVGHRSRKKALEELKGMGWYGDLDAMREGRVPEMIEPDHQDAAE
ncbi:type II toxin-antitoxin system VapB family antitoxin [Neorhizobium lilium]|uniref:Type II toxin-antitoxin system VapB family antitoxin n=1 Tax=Neorhizobium lilium TaxID=2503024 RepID=A0A3S3RR96_9HYPH|nr:type II toxin-antitoxin system VapB family antitoxin [Neorhizobium lilium]RWX75970.1 type II toxin-antitoxin system VapB family antitoxin [Neorhizobium lilium]